VHDLVEFVAHRGGDHVVESCTAAASSSTQPAHGAGDRGIEPAGAILGVRPSPSSRRCRWPLAACACGR
jgi:hypothetical protein